MTTTKDQLKQIAELAAARGFEWIAQDKENAVWYGYKVKPEFRQHSQLWWAVPDTDFAAINLPDDTDYSKQIFNINELLNNE